MKSLFVLYIFIRIHTKPFSCQIWSYLMPQNNWYKYIISSVFPFLFDWDCISQHRHIWWAIWVICGWDGIFQCRHIWWANWARPTVAHHNWFLPSSEDSTVAAREVETPPRCLFLTNLAFMHCSFLAFRFLDNRQQRFWRCSSIIPKFPLLVKLYTFHDSVKFQS